jgi:enoyl-CoA hydratase/carnithine racemase
VGGALALDAALERLCAPGARERFAMLAGEPLLVVDLAAAADAGADRLAIARAALAELPCVTLGLGAGSASHAGAALVDRFDVLASSQAELERLRAGVERSPIASLALAQLLRLTEALDIPGGLVAESLVYSTLQAGPEFAAWRAGRPPPKLREGRGPAVLVRREGDRLQLALNRPEKRNAFSTEVRDALVEALELATSDATIREVTLSGVGPAFCSGGDLDEFGTFPDPATAHAVRTTRSPARLLAACAERVRVHVHGACVGAGIELPGFAGHVAATPDAFFMLPEVGMGLVPGAGGSVSLPRRIGRQRTAYLALTGARIDATTALRWGLVDEVRPRQL